MRVRSLGPEDPPGGGHGNPLHGQRSRTGYSYRIAELDMTQHARTHCCFGCTALHLSLHGLPRDLRRFRSNVKEESWIFFSFGAWLEGEVKAIGGTEEISLLVCMLPPSKPSRETPHPLCSAS